MLFVERLYIFRSVHFTVNVWRICQHQGRIFKYKLRWQGGWSLRRESALGDTTWISCHCSVYFTVEKLIKACVGISAGMMG